MDSTDLVGGIAPTVLSWLVLVVAALTGDFVEARAQKIANDLADPSGSPQLRAEMHREIVSLVKGASLASALVATFLSYIYAAWTFLDKLNGFWWTFVTIGWGAIAAIYILQISTTLRPYQWDQHFVKKPWARWSSSSTFNFTHFFLLSAVLSLSGLIVVLGNAAAYIQANDAAFALHGTTAKSPHPAPTSIP